MIENIEKFKTKCAKWKVGLERLMIILPISFTVGFFVGFMGAKKKFMESLLYDGASNFERIEYVASIVIPFVLIYVYLFFIRQILGQFAAGQFFHQSVFKSISKVGQVSLMFGAVLMPFILLILMLVFADSYSYTDVLMTAVKGLNLISITLGVLLILVGHALRVAQVYYEEQKLTI